MATTREPDFEEEEAPLSVLTADNRAAIDQSRADERAYAAGGVGDRGALLRGPQTARPPAGGIGRKLAEIAV